MEDGLKVLVKDRLYRKMCARKDAAEISRRLGEKEALRAFLYRDQTTGERRVPKRTGTHRAIYEELYQVVEQEDREILKNCYGSFVCSLDETVLWEAFEHKKLETKERMERVERFNRKEKVEQKLDKIARLESKLAAARKSLQEELDQLKRELGLAPDEESTDTPTQQGQEAEPETEEAKSSEHNETEAAEEVQQDAVPTVSNQDQPSVHVTQPAEKEAKPKEETKNTDTPDDSVLSGNPEEVTFDSGATEDLEVPMQPDKAPKEVQPTQPTGEEGQHEKGTVDGTGDEEASDEAVLAEKTKADTFESDTPEYSGVPWPVFDDVYAELEEKEREDAEAEAIAAKIFGY